MSPKRYTPGERLGAVFRQAVDASRLSVPLSADRRGVVELTVEKTASMVADGLLRGPGYRSSRLRMGEGE